MKKNTIIFFFSILLGTLSLSQENDTLPYEFFKERIVLLADVGFNSAPFSIKDNYKLGVKKIRYKNNIKPAVGLGFAYKWFGLRIGFTLPLNMLDENKYGDTQYFELAIKANIKQTFCSIDLRSYNGYAVKDAYKFNDSLSAVTPNALMPFTRSASLSANVWYFRDKNFKMQAFQGRSAHFKEESKTWYFKGTLNFFGVSNDNSTIIPKELADTIDRKSARGIGAIDLGFIPGYAYGNRINNWQFGLFAGIGGVVQSKYYQKDGITRSFLGIAPRVDFKIAGGYSRRNYFVLLSSDFDIKSLKIQEMSYNQTYYNIRLMAGIRLHTKKSRKTDS
ncbi:MAG: DUF4421 family protein [Crocinitomicaceae bacterium]|nr:DUF4421 family protein [Crocinitomicaceae bacterium]